MSKKSQKEIAERLYIEGKSISFIAEELKVSRTTVDRWIKINGWQRTKEEKEEIYKTKISEDMHKLASRLLEDVSNEYFTQQTLNTERFTAFDRLMARINGAKKYDDETTHADQRQAISAETISQILKEMT